MMKDTARWKRGDEKHIPSAPPQNTQKKETSMEIMGNDINIDD